MTRSARQLEPLHLHPPHSGTKHRDRDTDHRDTDHRDTHRLDVLHPTLPHLPDPAEAFGLDPHTAPTLLGQRLLGSIGGKRGVVDGALPTIVFATGNVAGGLTVGLVAAAAVGLVLAVVRLVRREPVRQAVSGLLGLGIACAWALHAHKATAFYLPGILITAGYAVVLIGSILLRRPLVGVVAGLCSRDYVGWREHAALRRAMVAATTMWGLFYAASFGVRFALYQTGHATSLAALRLALGYPSTLGLIGLSVLFARAGTARRLSG